MLRGVEAVIVDEIHAVAGTKRGAHLALTLERLAALQEDGQRPAAHRPERDAEPARGGRPLHGRPAAHGDDRRRRRAQAARPEDPGAGRVDGRAGAVDRRDLDPLDRDGRRRGDAQLDLAGDLPRAARARPRAPLDDRLRQQPPRRRAPGAAAQRAGQRRPGRGRSRRARSRARTTARSPARSARRRGAAQGRRAAVPRRDLVARARHRHGRRRPRAAGRVAEVRRARPAAHRPRRPQRRRHLQGPHLPEVPRRPARVRGRRQAHARGPDRADRRAAQRARRARPADRRDRGRAPSDGAGRAVDDLYALVTRTHSYAELSRELLENVLDMLDGRYPSQEFAELRPRIVWDRVAGTIRARKGARQLAVTNAGTIPDRGLFTVVAARRPARRRARRGDGLRGAARARRSCSAPRRGGSRRSAATA